MVKTTIIISCLLVLASAVPVAVDQRAPTTDQFSKLEKRVVLDGDAANAPHVAAVDKRADEISVNSANDAQLTRRISLDQASSEKRALTGSESEDISVNKKRLEEAIAAAVNKRATVNGVNNHAARQEEEEATIQGTVNKRATVNRANTHVARQEEEEAPILPVADKRATVNAANKPASR